MTVWNVLLYTLGALAAMVLLCLGVMYFEKKAPSEEYDERQKLVRGNAFRLSFGIGFCYQLALYAIMQIKNELPLEPATLLLLGLLIQIMVFHIYCLLNHAALPLGQRGEIAIGAYLLAGVVQLVDFRNNMELYELYERNGFASEPWDQIWLQLAFAVAFGALAIMHLIRLLWKEKEG